ncbi:hypothetical protein BDV12DRAFT_192590 [Aspergillus spectabilis]
MADGQQSAHGDKYVLTSEVQSLLELGWRKTSAASLVDDNPDLRGAVDLIVFAAGSIGHLNAEGEREQFLRQAAEALHKTDRPRDTVRSAGANSVLAEVKAKDENPDDFNSVRKCASGPYHRRIWSTESRRLRQLAIKV